MLIVIDLFGDGEEVVKIDKSKQHDDECKRREEWLNWIRQNEAVLPQVVPVTQTKQQ